MPLRPIETCQKLLISTTSHLVGEFQRDRLILALGMARSEQSSNDAVVGGAALPESLCLRIRD
jgi:hypothetical protein